VWRTTLPGEQPNVQAFELPQNEDLMADIFVQKYDKVQRQLQAIAAVDELLSGN